MINTNQSVSTSQVTTSQVKKVFKPKKAGSAYDNMVILKRDLYYKEIVHANAEKVEAGTRYIIADIMWRYGKNHISKRELFNELEALRSGFACTDVPVKEAIRAIRAKN